jgi:uncharacterized membrane protein YfcA
MSATQLILALVVLFVGSAIQGSVGFGLNLFAAPLLVLIDPMLVPGPAIVASGFLNLLVIRRERAPHAWRQMRWPIACQVPGALAGAAAVALIAADDITIFFSILILIAVGLSISGLHPARTPRNLGIAGSVSGFMGTAVGIGGPPIALLFQRASGPEIRAALSRYFAAANVISLTMLALVGQLTFADVRAGLLLVPAVVLGYFASSALLGRVDAGSVRVAVLGLSGGSAIVALVRALV